MPPPPDSVKPFQANGVVVIRAMGTPVPLWLVGDTFPDGVHFDWIVQTEPKSAWCQLLVSPGLQVGIPTAAQGYHRPPESSRHFKGG